MQRNCAACFYPWISTANSIHKHAGPPIDPERRFSFGRTTSRNDWVRQQMVVWTYVVMIRYAWIHSRILWFSLNVESIQRAGVLSWFSVCGPFRNNLKETKDPGISTKVAGVHTYQSSLHRWQATSIDIPWHPWKPLENSPPPTSPRFSEHIVTQNLLPSE